MIYGRRARTGHNGDVEWCELSEEEVQQVLARNVRLNAEILAWCLERAEGLYTPEPEEEDEPSDRGPSVRKLALGLFAQCGIKGFVALQAALEEKVNFLKETTALRRPRARWAAVEEPNGQEEAVA